MGTPNTLPARRREHQSGNLPAQLTTFVGRRRELRAIKELMERGRLVTLTGPGGVGKSRLALSVAEETCRAFPDGTWLVELGGLSDPALVAQAVRDALGIRNLSAGHPTDILVEHLRHARALLIMDNCDHLLPGCSEVISNMLTACPKLHILATSRERLGAVGESIWIVDPLPLPASDDKVLDNLESYPAVQLFQDRAGAARPGFAVDEANIAAVSAVCRRAEGIPLAIELAAVRLRSLNTTQLLEAMEDRFSLLTKGYATAPERQRSLLTVIDWSYELCSEAERSLWQRSSVFAGGFDLEAACTACADNGMPATDMADLIGALIDKSILQRENYGDYTRYRMLETLREYGRRHIAPDDLARWQARHSTWCLDLVGQAARNFFGPDQLKWGRRLVIEHANLRAALTYCLTDPKAGMVGLGIAAELRFYWFTAGLLTEGRRWLRLLLELVLEPTPTRVAALEVAGYLAILQGEPTAGNRLLEEGRNAAVGLGDQTGLAKIAYAQGLAEMLTGRPTEAALHFHECLNLNRETKQPPSAMDALTYSHLATLACVTGDMRSASAWCDRGLEMSQEAGEIWCRAFGFWARGIIACCGGEREQAIRDECQSLRLNMMFGDRVHGALAIEALAWVAAAEGSHERAAMLLGGLDTTWSDLGTSLFNHVSGLHENCERDSRQALGSVAYEQAFTKGRGVPFTDLVALALAVDPNRPTEPSPASSLPAHSPLTHREQEVADLIAQGKGNRDIASALVISERTVESHISHIFIKLNCDRRSEVAVWVHHQPGAG